MEGSCNRELLGRQTSDRKNGCRPVDLAVFPGEDRLSGGIPVGYDQVKPLFLNNLFNGCQGRRHRQHPPPVTTISGHQSAPQARKVVQGGFINTTGSTESGQFAIAVPCRCIS